MDPMLNRHPGFDVAKELIYSKHRKLTLKPSKIEDLCLAASREFYDNASSANYKVGDMKLAYDWCAFMRPEDINLLMHHLAWAFLCPLTG
jgi:hypothetical protein